MLGVGAHVLGIRPWEWARMTVEETDAALDWLDGYLEEMERAAEEIERG